jgi:hypothetical protein
MQCFKAASNQPRRLLSLSRRDITGESLDTDNGLLLLLLLQAGKGGRLLSK